MGLESFILIAIFLLIILSIGDIIVGVSNDAVNFLNSAIGCRVASRKTTITIAGIGILCGALSSTGMMEIARKGVINPENFSLYEVIIIFLSIMITDVILLDLFNTLGIPTSTTVSLIFELLGSAFMVSVFKIIQKVEPLNFLLNINNSEKGYLNWDKTNEIVSSIFLSILLAFFLGIIVQYISRILFTFHYVKKMKTIGIIWSAIAITCMSYYLIYKGLKSMYSDIEITKKEMIEYLNCHKISENYIINDIKNKIVVKDTKKKNIYRLIPLKYDNKKIVYNSFYGHQSIKEFVHYVDKNILAFLLGFLIFWTIIFTIFNRFNINILKIIILFGTFSMAMAFAGNDLVNFIGIPIAAIQSYEIFQYSHSVSNPLGFNMIGLKFPIESPYIYIFFSGILMIITLCFSKKAKNVTETELKLASQEEVEEGFKPNALSKLIVKTSMIINNMFRKIVSKKLIKKINSRFIPLNNTNQKAHFDLVRASVNLTVASTLIAIGTDLKLPLSSTYVTFMVAMGTSLADRAWGRENAVYRIAGVINVIGSWILIGIIAFIGSGITALIIINFRVYGLFFMLMILLIVVIKTSINNQKKIKLKLEEKRVIDELSFVKKEILEKSTTKISEGIYNLSIIYNLAINGILTENLNLVKKSKSLLKELKNNFSNTRSNVIKVLKKSNYLNDKSSQIYLILNEIMTDNVRSLELLVETSFNHIENSHKPLYLNQINEIKNIYINIGLYLVEIKKTISNSFFKNDFEKINKIKNIIYENIAKTLDNQSQGISSKKYGFKNSTLMFSVLLESKDIVTNSYRLLNSFKKIIENNDILIS